MNRYHDYMERVTLTAEEEDRLLAGVLAAEQSKPKTGTLLRKLWPVATAAAAALVLLGGTAFKGGLQLYGRSKEKSADGRMISEEAFYSDQEITACVPNTFAATAAPEATEECASEKKEAAGEPSPERRYLVLSETQQAALNGLVRSLGLTGEASLVREEPDWLLIIGTEEYLYDPANGTLTGSGLTRSLTEEAQSRLDTLLGQLG